MKPQDDDDDSLVNNFVEQVHTSVVKSSTIEFPKERLAALLDENAQMKQDTERLLEKLQSQEFLLDEYKRAIDEEL